MRKIATVKKINTNAVRLMLFDKGKDGVFVFGYNTEEDSSCFWDCHYSNLVDAYEMGTEYGIQKDDWVEISDPLEYCQDDWIQPVRIIGRKNGNSQYGELELLVDGKWTKIN
ncbi:hypothetical protein [Dokdonia sp.]|uniref:hypothetical protein n=1 Tax=Dokdonia sp. TaxID=2024995 RepID=UPI003263FECF